MDETYLLNLSLAIVAAMFGLLTAVLGWLGSRIYSKLDEMGKTMNAIASDLHEKINGLDRRVTVVETQQQVCHQRHSQ